VPDSLLSTLYSYSCFLHLLPSPRLTKLFAPRSSRLSFWISILLARSSSLSLSLSLSLALPPSPTRDDLLCCLYSPPYQTTNTLPSLRSARFLGNSDLQIQDFNRPAKPAFLASFFLPPLAYLSGSDFEHKILRLFPRMR
jgi:hypothetical protein